MVATPTGMSPSFGITCSASCFARSSRVTPCGPVRADIEVELSKTKNACTSNRCPSNLCCTTTGWAAATPISTGSRASATMMPTSSRRRGVRSEKARRMRSIRVCASHRAASGITAASANSASIGVRKVKPIRGLRR